LLERVVDGALVLGVVSSIVPARTSIKTTVVEGLRELD